MRNAELTISRLLKQSGDLFNTKGYQATSLSDITTATGLTKGAIYRHFGSKERLEQEALNQLSAVMFEKMRGYIVRERTAGDKLRAVFRFFESYITDPPIAGGCPLLNAAIEADDAHPVLRRSARKILDVMTDSLSRIIENGIRYKQFRPGTDKVHLATLIVASLEGAIMMGKLKGKNDDIRRVVRHLEEEVKKIERKR